MKESDDDPWPIMLSTALMAAEIPVEWKVSRRPVTYGEAVRQMENRVERIRRTKARELVWLLEHPALYTAGTSAKDADLLDARFPVFKSGRAVSTPITARQRIAYVMLDLKRRKPDARAYVHDLEEWLIRTLSRFASKAKAVPGASAFGSRAQKTAKTRSRRRRQTASLGDVPRHQHEHRSRSIAFLGHRAFAAYATRNSASPAWPRWGIPSLSRRSMPALKLSFAEIFGPVTAQA